MRRAVGAEALDALAPDHPDAIGSRRDLRRLHWLMGTVPLLRRGLAGWGDAGAGGARLRILELGAGDGSLMLRAAAVLKRDWPAVDLTLLDRQALVTPATIAAYAACGWKAVPHAADVMDWAAAACSPVSKSDSDSGPHAPRWDIVVANLFLHHFTAAQLRLILDAVAATADRFFACEPRRSWRALGAAHLVGAIGANALTRKDAVLSVQAGFIGYDLTQAWPAKSTWRLVEYPAGLFSHCFRAQRERR